MCYGRLRKLTHWLQCPTPHRYLIIASSSGLWQLQDYLFNCLPDISRCLGATSNPSCPKLFPVFEPCPFSILEDTKWHQQPSSYVQWVCKNKSDTTLSYILKVLSLSPVDFTSKYFSNLLLPEFLPLSPLSLVSLSPS
jgi:hypothetical protein